MLGRMSRRPARPRHVCWCRLKFTPAVVNVESAISRSPASPMNFRQFEALYWIGRLGSFHAAARQLRTLQPAISARIRELELELRVLIFDRADRRLRPTAKGLELLPSVSWLSPRKSGTGWPHRRRWRAGCAWELRQSLLSAGCPPSTRASPNRPPRSPPSSWWRPAMLCACKWNAAHLISRLCSGLSSWHGCGTKRSAVLQ